jgi:hypothetical protein
MNFRYEDGIAATDAGSQEVGRDLIPEIMDAIARDLGLPADPSEILSFWTPSATRVFGQKDGQTALTNADQLGRMPSQLGER